MPMPLTTTEPATATSLEIEMVKAQIVYEEAIMNNTTEQTK